MKVWVECGRFDPAKRCRNEACSKEHEAASARDDCPTIIGTVKTFGGQKGKPLSLGVVKE